MNIENLRSLGHYFYLACQKLELNELKKINIQCSYKTIFFCMIKPDLASPAYSFKLSAETNRNPASPS